ncbi:hypothetical protein O181_108309 [Austropuccinia psidii MF-1]|uniref:Tc1-like transposase DDE domain-containing protein n=1 Tax=Austropuccinia psidii MF-1 TaxID=1389203 RepID=A0A9Q3PNU4_9BASI|nr:hypothetical protein [Austropuccinia psidii MF-1]
MEDNALIHMAAFSNQWRKQNGILKMEWPAHSPDLNPIKNIWKSMKSQISKLYQPQNLEELKHAIQSCWSDIHPGILNAKEDADGHQSAWWSNLILGPPRFFCVSFFSSLCSLSTVLPAVTSALNCNQ